MRTLNIDLNTLNGITYNGKYLDKLIFNGVEIWRKNKALYRIVIEKESVELESSYQINDFDYSSYYGILFCVGNNNSIYKTSTFDTWSLKTTQSSSNNFTCIKYNNAISSGKAFIACGTNNSVNNSNNADKWFNVSNASKYNITNVAVHKNYFICNTEVNWAYCQATSGTKSFYAITSDGHSFYDIKKNIMLLDDGYAYYRSSYNTAYSSLTKRSYLGDAKKLVESPTSDSTLYALYNNGLYKSMDNFISFTDHHICDDTIIDCAVTSSGIIIMICDNGKIYATEDLENVYEVENPTNDIFSKIVIDGEDIILSRNDFKKYYKISIVKNN